MNSRIVTITLALTCTGAVVGQTLPATDSTNPTPARRSLFGRSSGGPAPAATSPTTAPAVSAAASPTDPNVVKSGNVVPPPVALDEIGRPAIPLPTTPVEPFLLTRNNGPFMVLAYTFHGPQSVRYAQALAIELRQKDHLPAYIFFLRIQPGHSNIRNVPPTATPEIQNDESLKGPERYREYDEAAVLVGDCKTIDDAKQLLHSVKKMHPTTVDGLPSIWKIRMGKGLSRATLTTNPMAASQDLYPAQGLGKHHSGPAVQPGAVVDPSVLTASLVQSDDKNPQWQVGQGPGGATTAVLVQQSLAKPDPMIVKMNQRPWSIFKCPGPYTLQVAEFLGRSAVEENERRRLQDDTFLRRGSLATAAEDAERLAASLAKCKKLDKRFQPFVYHDRTSSKVFLGTFQGPNDPSLQQLRAQITPVSEELLVHKYTLLPLAPLPELTPVPRP